MSPQEFSEKQCEAKSDKTVCNVHKTVIFAELRFEDRGCFTALRYTKAKTHPHSHEQMSKLLCSINLQLGPNNSIYEALLPYWA